MPTRSAKPCGRTGCVNLASSSRYCDECSQDRSLTQGYDFKRGNSHQRGYDRTWQKFRLLALQRDSFLCQYCLMREQRPTPATEVDHRIPIAAAPHLRLVLSNLVSTCTPCHSEKTAREDGSFGNKKKIHKVN